MASQGFHNADYMLYLRPISDEERQVAVRSLRPIRYNAIGMAIMGVITSIMLNYAHDAIVVVVPLMFAVGAIGYASQFKKTAGALTKALSTGKIHELRAAPVKKSMGRGWTVGPVSFSRSGQLGDMFTEGSTAAVALIPDTKAAISINSMPLKKAMPIIAPLGFGKELVGSVPAGAPHVEHPVSVTNPSSRQQAEEDLPPPPDDWEPRACPKCGEAIIGEVLFCSRCGYRLKE